MRSNFLLIILFLFSLNNLFAQKTQHVKEILDTNSFFFEHDIKYIGKSTTISPNYIYVMQSLQEQLKSNPLLSIHVRGHVCCGPSKPISEKRARKAAKYLEKIGVKKERISYCGYSNTRPLVLPEKTEDDAQKNRRVDFILTKQ